MKWLRRFVFPSPLAILAGLASHANAAAGGTNLCASRALPAVSILLLLLSAHDAHAEWPHDPAVNLPVWNQSGSGVGAPRVIPDGGGGVLVVFCADGYTEISAQHVLAEGVVAWGQQGIYVGGSEYVPYLSVVPDGAGGAIVVWTGLEGSTTYKVRAHRVLSSGQRDPAWPDDGLVVYLGPPQPDSIDVVPDGAGGAIVAMRANQTIVAQHVLASGSIDPAWPAAGLLVCDAVCTRRSAPAIVPDGAGGAIIGWTDDRSLVSQDVYAMRVLASGVKDPSWSANGQSLCTEAHDQLNLQMLEDDEGGAYLAWEDLRSGAADIYAVRVQASRFKHPDWPTNGGAVCAAAGAQTSLRLVSDAAGGLIATWQDERSGNLDIYAQRMLPWGLPDPAWPVNGRALCTTTGNPTFGCEPEIAADGAGGAIVTWKDNRGLGGPSARYVYAQRVLASGAVPPAWPTNGRVFSTAVSGKSGLQVAPDDEGGVIIAWLDGRDGYLHLYAQRAERFGQLGNPEPRITSLSDYLADEGGKVTLIHAPSYLDVESNPALTHYDVLRSVPPGPAALRLAAGERACSLEESGSKLAPGSPGLVITRRGADDVYWEFLPPSTAAQHPASSGRYYVTCATTGDSVAGSNPLTKFMVVGRNADRTRYWPSAVDSTYSVDNLAPTAPTSFTGEYAAGTTWLHWLPNGEPDLAGYRLYRGQTPDFTADGASFVAALPDTGYADAAGQPFYYKLAAVDVHGNQGPTAFLMPSGTTGIPGPAALPGLSFAPPHPNPARELATLRFTLPCETRVVLALHDVSGRCVRTLADGSWARGEHSIGWDLCDDAGRVVPPGLYLARLEADGRRLVRRLVAVR